MAPARTVAAAAVGLLLALTVVSPPTPAAGAPAPAPPPAVVRLPAHVAAALAPLSRQALAAITGNSNDDNDDDDDDDDDDQGEGGGGSPLDGLPPIQCQTIASIAESAADVVQELLALGVPPPRANAFQTTVLAAYPTFVVETRPGGITCVPTEPFGNFIVDTFLDALGNLLDEGDDDDESD